jgi:hypothetical protein
MMQHIVFAVCNEAHMNPLVQRFFDDVTGTVSLVIYDELGPAAVLEIRRVR